MSNADQTVLPRGRFHGVAQIIRFNRPQYVMAVAAISVAFSILRFPSLPAWLVAGLWLGIALGLWWSVASMVVSFWVYDLSYLMAWKWLKVELPERPRRWLNLHAGFDESTASLRGLWSEATGLTGDIFSDQYMTEGSIRRARAGVNVNARDSRVDWAALPFRQAEFDHVFLLFAAHELREAGVRQSFFREIGRILARDGNVVVVEHLRNPANFIAYGPGFMHFHSRRTWERDFRMAGLEVDRVLRFTPFVCAFFLKRKL